MANYVLVHGGDRDGSIWNEVAALLKKSGHHIFCPSMTSIKKATLQENIDEVIDYIASKQLDDFILVGHSYGGFVITGVADQLSDKILGLAFVDTLIPENGKSLHDITVDFGFDYQASGLTLDPAVMSKINFDPEKVFARPKVYIHCLQSEFLSVTKPTYENLKNETSGWLLFCLDTIHNAMENKSKELAVILFGMQLLL